MDIKRFSGKVAIVTGSATGIGEACAIRFAREGAHIVCVDWKGEENEKTVEQCREHGVDAIDVVKDVREPEGADSVVTLTMEKLGRIDILVCSAGIYTGSLLPEVSLEQWREMLEVNLTGTFLYNKAVAPGMMEQKSGSIINISSMAGKTSWPATAEYSASKSGVIGLTRSVAVELGPYGITVNAICPGNTLTPMVKKVAAEIGALNGMTGEEWLAMRASDAPLKRLAAPWEMAGITAFLASEDSRYITGQSISADGGIILS